MDSIIFYAGSSEGKLLVDATIFIYKVMEYKEQNFVIDTKNISSTEGIKLFFDISYVSGRTCKKIKETSLLKNDSFNHHFVIALEENHMSDKFTSIFEYKQYGENNK